MTAPTPPPTAVEVLVMDLGGVCCRWLPDRRLAALAAISDLPPGTIDGLLFESGWDDACERGRFELAELLEQLRAMLGLAAGPDADAVLRAAWAQAFEPDPAVVGWLPWAICRTALFTNNGPLLEVALDHELARVGERFEERLFSWRLGVTKPDPAAFERATEALDVDPAAIFFVDDSPANVAAAEAAGWRGHRFTDALTFRAVLLDAGIAHRPKGLGGPGPTLVPDR